MRKPTTVILQCAKLDNLVLKQDMVIVLVQCVLFYQSVAEQLQEQVAAQAYGRKAGETLLHYTDETLWEALRENDATAENDPHLEADLSSDETDCESDSSSCTDETIDEDLDTETNYFDLDEGSLLKGITD